MKWWIWLIITLILLALAWKFYVEATTAENDDFGSAIIDLGLACFFALCFCAGLTLTFVTFINRRNP